MRYVKLNVLNITVGGKGKTFCDLPNRTCTTFLEATDTERIHGSSGGGSSKVSLSGNNLLIAGGGGGFSNNNFTIPNNCHATIPDIGNTESTVPKEGIVLYARYIVISNKKNRVTFNQIKIFDNEGNHQSTLPRELNKLKNDVYDVIKDKWNVIFCLEDNSEQVKRFRSAGLTCFQVGETLKFPGRPEPKELRRRVQISFALEPIDDKPGLTNRFEDFNEFIDPFIDSIDFGYSPLIYKTPSLLPIT